MKKRKLFEEQLDALKAEDRFTLSQADKSSKSCNLLDNAPDIKLRLHRSSVTFNHSESAEPSTVSVSLHKITAGVSLSIWEPGFRPTGHGKTTLLNHMTQRKPNIPPNIDILLCEQELEKKLSADFENGQADAGTRLKENFTSEPTSMSVVVDKENKRATIIDIAVPNDYNIASKEKEKVYGEIKAIGVDSAEPKARRISAGLGFTKEIQERPTKHFSGGWTMRVSLARSVL
ncbi:ATP-binding cassette sub-family F member 1-like [Watersipora subatra]|uniref:ATP-binding cassette sub-family F member 1-like n=1 Tax=Watersipora subatra TaxID=2589382 RepID=UPI00355C830D